MSEPGPSIIELRGLSKVYGEGTARRVVFENLDTSIRSGETVALLGRSGSGKTTLLNLISGIDAPTAGQVIVDGVDVAAMNEHERTLFRRNHVGFVFQFFNLIPTLTVYENLMLPVELKGGRTQDAQAYELLERVGLRDRADEFPDRLSGGEQQRVAIARALVSRPSLILADEPTGNLDSETGENVLDLLLTMTREVQGTLVMVTHSRAVARQAERILAVRDGAVIEVPRHEVGEQDPV